MRSDLHIGVDLGDTHVRAGLFYREPGVLNLINQHRCDVPAPRNRDMTLKCIRNCIEEANKERRTVTGIGLLSPGPLNHRSGELGHLPYMPELRGVNLRQWVRDTYCRSGSQVGVATDTHGALWAEMHCPNGQLRDKPISIYVSVSTGISGAIAISGKIQTGRRGKACEVGHILCRELGGVCSCGAFGCVEAAASGAAISTWSTELAMVDEPSLLREEWLVTQQPLTVNSVAQAWKDGDHLATVVINRSIRALAQMVVSLTNLYDPEAICFGGSVINLDDRFLLLVIDEVQKIAPPSLELPQIVRPHYGDDVGLWGAIANLISPIEYC